jgi:LacI family purine nucleotide synthesis repressor
LLELGHCDIGMACSSGLRGERYEGFERAMKEFDLKPRREWLLGSDVIDDTGLYSGLYVEGGVRLAQLFLKLKKRPTAVCLMDDSAAVGFAAELERAGVHVPGDVSVIGHDNLPIAQYGPLPLTTVTHPVDAIVEKVVELLHSRLEGYDGPPRKVVIRGELIVRESTRPLAILNPV